MKKVIYSLLVLSFCAMLFQCKKDVRLLDKKDDLVVNNDSILANTNTLGSIDNFFKSNSSPKQNFTLNNGSFSTSIIETSNNSKLYFPYHTFYDSLNNNYPTSVIITVKEAFSYKDFMTNNLETVTTTGDLLNSAGMIFYDAKTSSGGKLAQVKPISISYTIKNNSEIINNTKVFTLNASTNSWELNTASTSTITSDTMAIYSSYAMTNVSGLGNWINCDAFVNCPNLFPGKDFEFKTIGNFTSKNTVVFALFYGMPCSAINFTKTLIRCHGDLNQIHQFFLKYNVPSNANIKAVAFSKISDKWYYEEKPCTLIQNSGVTFSNMQEKDSLQIINLLQNL